MSGTADPSEAGAPAPFQTTGYIIPGGVKDSFGEQSEPFASTTGEVQGANFLSTLFSSPEAHIARETAEGYANGIPPYLGEGMPPPPMPENVQLLQPADLQKQFPGGKFTAPMSVDAAKDIYEHQQAETQRQEIIARRGDSILTGGAARFAVSAIAGLLSPTNDIAAMLPVLPEARVASMLAAQGESVFGRAAVRAGVGALQGAAGQAALEPLQAVFDKNEGEDWAANDMFQRILMGAAIGAGMHATLGVISDKLSPDQHATVAQTALAQTMNDEPVQIQPLVDHIEARNAADALEAWNTRQQQIFGETADLQNAPSIEAPDRSAAIADSEARLSQLRESEAQITSEIQGVQQRRITTGFDPETEARLQDVNAELGGVIPRTRRAALENERQMLMEGRGQMDVSAGDPLEQARNMAQETGLNAELSRIQDQRAAMEQQLATARAQDDAAQADAQARRTSADRQTRIQQARLDSQASVVQAMTEKEVRRFAAKIDVRLEDHEVTSIARDIRLAQPGEVRDVIDHALTGLAQRSPRTDLMGSNGEPPAVPGAGIARLRAEADGAAQDVVRQAQAPVQDNRIVTAEQQNATAVQRAPKIDSDVEKQLAEATKEVQDLQRMTQREIAAGRLPEQPAELTAADEAAAAEISYGKAADAAAACMALKGF